MNLTEQTFELSSGKTIYGGLLIRIGMRYTSHESPLHYDVEPSGSHRLGKIKEH